MIYLSSLTLAPETPRETGGKVATDVCLWFEVRSSRFSEPGTMNFELRVAPVVHRSHFHPAAFVYHNHLQSNNLDRRSTFP
jgi:hypothetical protein